MKQFACMMAVVAAAGLAGPAQAHSDHYKDNRYVATFPAEYPVRDAQHSLSEEQKRLLIRHGRERCEDEFNHSWGAIQSLQLLSDGRVRCRYVN